MNHFVKQIHSEKPNIHYEYKKQSKFIGKFDIWTVSIFKSNTKTYINGKQQSGSFTFLGDIKPDIV